MIKLVIKKIIEEPIDLSGKVFLTIADHTKEEIEYLIMLGIDLKKKLKMGMPYQPLKGKRWV